MPPLTDTVGKLRTWLHAHSFIPGDKLPAKLTPVEIDEYGVLQAEIQSIGSEMQGHLAMKLPLGLVGYEGELELQSVFSAVQGARCGDAGNVQNMIVDLATMISNSPELVKDGRPRLTVASSSDPFLRLSPEHANRLREVCDVYELDSPDRMAIHFPWRGDERQGTLVIASEPQRVNEALNRIMRENDAFRKRAQNAICVVSDQPIFDELGTFARVPYSVVINASTAFRSLVTAESYGRAVTLPMNAGEASDVCRMLMQRAYGYELEQINRPAFPVPLTIDGSGVDAEALCALDESLAMMIRCVPLPSPGFGCPITFGADGGIVVGVGHERVACFASALSTDGEKSLLRKYCDDNNETWDHLYEISAGDASASIITLFNVLSPSPFIQLHMGPADRGDRRLLEVASTVFVNVLSRIAGAFILRFPETHLSGQRRDMFEVLCKEVALESLQVARGLSKGLNHPCVAQIPRWGIKITVWELGSPKAIRGSNR